MNSKNGCKNPIIEVIAGKSFKNMDFLKHITYNMEWWNFYGYFIIGMAYTVCLLLIVLWNRLTEEYFSEARNYRKPFSL